MRAALRQLLATPASGRRLAPPVVVVALLWVGVQVLVLLYLRSVLVPSIAGGSLEATLLLSSLARTTGAEWPLRTWLVLVDLMFVALLWLRYRAVRWAGRGERFGAFLVHAGPALLLLVTQMAWEALLRVDPGWVLERIWP